MFAVKQPYIILDFAPFQGENSFLRVMSDAEKKNLYLPSPKNQGHHGITVDSFSKRVSCFFPTCLGRSQF